MNAERVLQILAKRAAVLTASRAPGAARAARRARGALAAVRAAIRADADAAQLVRATLEGVLILAALEQRGRRRSDRRRGQALAGVGHVPARKVTDAELALALAECGGRVREAARRLAVAPSTVSRRSVADRDGTQHRGAPGSQRRTSR